MRKTISLAFTIIACFCQLSAQVLPHEGSKLNYRLVGFSFPRDSRAKVYEIEIATGNYKEENPFKKNIVTRLKTTSNKLIATLPSFGKNYTWRVVFTTANSKTISSEFHHFSTGTVRVINPTSNRLRIIEKAAADKDAYIFVDGTGVLYDMTGSPVWYLPGVDTLNDLNARLRDLKLSPRGTITYLLNGNAFETDYNGTVLWAGPHNDTTDATTDGPYHHEFTRLANGNYMLYSTDHFRWKLPFAKDSTARNSEDSARFYQFVSFGTLMEYDSAGNKVWSWNPEEYFRTSDLHNMMRDNGIYDMTAHENSFDFDQKNEFIYVSCRNISRLLKVKYPEGTVVNVYGKKYEPGVTDLANDFFCDQHCCRHSEKGYLYLFDNNFCHPDGVPKIIALQEPAAGNELKKNWAYECTVEKMDKEKRKDINFSSGGNVMELPDGSFFTCMGGNYCKVFIVTKKKKVLWSAVPEKWNAELHRWDFLAAYRASVVVNARDMQRLIWNQEKMRWHTTLEARSCPH